jgi:hypothetical protein
VAPPRLSTTPAKSRERCGHLNFNDGTIIAAHTIRSYPTCTWRRSACFLDILQREYTPGGTFFSPHSVRSYTGSGLSWAYTARKADIMKGALRRRITVTSLNYVPTGQLEIGKSERGKA